MTRDTKFRVEKSKRGEGGPITISASEIGEYAYCSRAWWYRHVVKLAPPAAASAQQAGRFSVGKEAHARHGREVGQAARLRTLGLVLALGGALIILAAVFAMLFTS